MRMRHQMMMMMIIIIIIIIRLYGSSVRYGMLDKG